MAEGDLHAVYTVDGGVAGRGAAQRGDQRVGNKTHVHEVVLDGIGKLESFENAALAYPQIAEHGHRDSHRPLQGRQKENTTRKVRLQYTASRLGAANGVFR